MEKAGKSQGEGIQGQGQMVLQKKSEAFWQSWWVGGDENGMGTAKVLQVRTGSVNSVWRKA